MAITGVFSADFTSFYDAVQKAEVQLRSFESGASRVETQLNRVSDSFSGRRVITEATLMSEAISRAGGVTQLTDAELRRAGATAQEAAEKMKKLGMEVPPGIQSVVDASLNLSNSQRGVSESSERMRSSLRQVDNIMDVFGIRILSEVKGLEQMIEVSDKTVTQIGALAAGTAVAGAAFAGWTVGRHIAEFFDLDKAISGTTARLMGWGDLVGQTMAAKADVLAAASEHAGRTITSMAEAVKINEEWLKKHQNTIIDWDARLAIARESVSKLSAEEIKKIQTAKELGATTQELTDKFGVSADVLKVLDKQLQVTEGNEKKLAETQMALSKARAESDQKALELRKAAEVALAQITAETNAQVIAMTGTKRDAEIAAINAEFQAQREALQRRKELTEQTEAALEQKRDARIQREMADYDRINAMSRSALQERADFEKNTLDEMLRRSGEFSAAQIAQQRDTWFAAQEAVRNFGLAADSALTKVEQKTASVAQAAQKMSQSFTMSVQPLTETEVGRLRGEMPGFRQLGLDPGGSDENLWRKLGELESREGTYTPRSGDQYAAMLREQELLAQLRMWAQGKQRPPGFASGVENFSGGLAYVHKDELLVNMPQGTSVIPANRAGGGGHTFYVTNYINGGGTKRDGQRVGRGLVEYLRSKGVRLEASN